MLSYFRFGYLCRKDGNLFNISIAPLPPPTSSSAPPISGSPISAQTPPSQRKPGEQADGPSRSAESGSTGRKKSLSAKRVVWISIAAVLSFIILVLAILLFLPRCLRKWHETERTPKHHEIAPYVSARENPGDSGSLVQPGHGIEKGARKYSTSIIHANFILSIVTVFVGPTFSPLVSLKKIVAPYFRFHLNTKVCDISQMLFYCHLTF